MSGLPVTTLRFSTFLSVIFAGSAGCARLAGYLATLLMAMSGPAFASDSLVMLEKMIHDKEYDQAVTIASRLQRQSPADPRLKFLDARLLSETGKEKQAEQIYHELIREYPYRPEPYNNLAVLYARDGRYRQAKDLLEQAVQSSPAYASAHQNLQQIYVQLASEAYREALEPEDAETAPKTSLAYVDSLDLPVATTGPDTHETQVVAATASLPDNGGIMQAVNNWARAWSDQDVDSYLALYDKDFIPDSNMSREDWARQRHERLKSPRFIRVSIRRSEITPLADDVVSVTFMQTYESDLLNDTVRKQLLMKQRQGGWRILQENLMR